MPKFNNFLHGASLLIAMLIAQGCNSRRALNEHRFKEVDSEIIVDIGNEEDVTHANDLIALLDTRLKEGDHIVDEEQAVEALIALCKMEYDGEGDLVLSLADLDPSSDVRYFAVELLQATHASLFKANKSKLLKSEDDPLIKRLINDSIAP